MLIYNKVTVVAVLACCLCGWGAMAGQAFSLVFPREAGADCYAWLQQNGFVLKKGAADRGNFKLSFAQDGLMVQADKPALGLIVKDGLQVKNFKHMVIKWGVINYPPGANWDKEVHNEPLMVYVFFGDQRYSSDSMFIPNSPPFIGFYLGKQDKVGRYRTGRHFTTGGRYVCLANPPAGRVVMSDINLVEAFKKAFGDSIAMPSYISGISIESDTSDLVSSSRSVSFIKSIEIND